MLPGFSKATVQRTHFDGSAEQPCFMALARASRSEVSISSSLSSPMCMLRAAAITLSTTGLIASSQAGINKSILKTHAWFKLQSLEFIRGVWLLDSGTLLSFGKKFTPNDCRDRPSYCLRAPELEQ